MRGIFGRNRPAISVDPGAARQIGQITDAVRALNAQMSTLVGHAQAYAAAMGAAVRPKGTGRGAGTWPGRNRPQNFPQIQQPQTGGGGGGGGGGQQQQRGGGGFLSSFGGVELAVLLPQIRQAIAGQVGQLVERERVTTRLAMAQTGPYQGVGQAGPWQRMLRGATGYSGTGDLYAGAQTLGQLGLMTAPNDPRTRSIVRQTGQLAIMGGTNYQTAAQAVAGFMAPQTVNALLGGALGRSINATPGGQISLFGQGKPGQAGYQQSLFEQMFQALNRGRQGAGTEQFFRTGLRPGSPLYMQLQSAGFSDEQMQMIQQYGIARGEGKSADQVQKDISKRYKDVGENLRRFNESISDLKDSFSDSLLPAITAIVDAINPVLRLFGKLIAPMNSTMKALTLLTAAFLAAAAKTATSNAISSMTGGGGIGALMGQLGQAGVVGTAGALGGLGMMGLLGTTVLTGIGGFLGSKVGRAVGGKGWKGKAGSVLGGAAGGAATGAALGTLGGPFTPLTSTAGAIAGGLIGGIGGLLGDPVPPTVAYSDKALLANPPPPYTTPGGGPLPGPGNSANLNPDFLSRLQKMFAANPKLSVTSGWRSHEEQAYLRWQLLTGKRKAAVAPVGTSRHETGLAADLGPPSQYNWLKQHATEYGVANVGAKFGEAWHYEPVGSVTPSPAPAPATPTPATPPASTSAPAPATAAVTGATTTSGVKPKITPPTTGSSASGGLGANEVDILAGFGWGGSSDMGDPVPGGSNPPLFVNTSRSGGMGGGGNLTIGKVDINLSFDRATPEEAERSARTIAALLSDRDRLLAVARGRGNN